MYSADLIMAQLPSTAILYLFIFTLPFANCIILVNNTEFCLSINDGKQTGCPTGSVISIVENTLGICYTEYCGDDSKNGSIFGQLKTALFERCHGKQECSLEENDVVSSMCSLKGNSLNFTYMCIDLHGAEEVTLGDDNKRIDANKEIHVRNKNYPNMTFGQEAMTYTCTFTNREQRPRNKLFFQLQRVMLAEDSQLQINVDNKWHMSLVGSRNDSLIGPNNCDYIPYDKWFWVLYRQCQRYTSAMWITINASTSLHVRCRQDAGPTKCSQISNENVCNARKVDFPSNYDMICNCSNEVIPTSGGTGSMIIVAIILLSLLTIGALVCVLVYVLFWKSRVNRKKDEPQNDNHYTDTPSICTERRQSNHNYTEIDLPPLRHYLPSAIHTMDIDLPPSLPLRNTQDNSPDSDPHVKYGKVNKPNETEMQNVQEMEKNDRNVNDGLKEVEEDETIMQENTDLYS